MQIVGKTWVEGSREFNMPDAILISDEAWANGKLRQRSSV